MRKNFRKYYYNLETGDFFNITCLTRKELLFNVDDYLENIEFVQDDDVVYGILYNNGDEDYIDSGYDGHKIKRQNIVSIVENNPCEDLVYGGYEINEHGVVTPNENIKIAGNIIEISENEFNQKIIRSEVKKYVI